MTAIKLNVGCGFDYRDGFVNIDGSDALPRIDKVVDLSSERLTDHYPADSVDHILANDFVEHHFHWEAVALLRDFHQILKPQGTLEIRVPDVTRIVIDPRISMEEKITLLYGGQDISQGKGDEVSRALYPDFFCHKYGYTRKTMTRELSALGFGSIQTQRAGANFIATAAKSSEPG
jgi:hypothetical protein